MQNLTQSAGRPAHCKLEMLLWLASQQGFPEPKRAVREPLPLRQRSQAAGDSGHLDSKVEGHLLLSYPQHLGQMKVLWTPVFSYLVFSLSALEKEMATHSSILAWKIPWMEEPGRPIGSQRVRHDWVTALSVLLQAYPETMRTGLTSGPPWIEGRKKERIQSGENYLPTITFFFFNGK